MSAERILLAHGGGGQLTDELIRDHILNRLGNQALDQLGDSALLEVKTGLICFSTDSYVIKPLFFNGGDIGKLAVCGTINDLAVAGARPLALSLGLIMEEGLELAVLDRVLDSVARTAQDNGVDIVTGDTKTVEAGSADKLFINTAGIGVKITSDPLGFDQITPDDRILLSGTLGDHGMTIMSEREDIRFKSQLRSDCAALGGLIEQLLTRVPGIKFMRDPTRGGLSAALNEIARGADCAVEIHEKDIPIHPSVQAAADMLGFDVLNIANEGKFVMVVAPESAAQGLALCRSHPLAKDAALIGRIGETADLATVELVTRIGGRRIVQMPYGRELPRIC